MRWLLQICAGWVRREIGIDGLYADIWTVSTQLTNDNTYLFRSLKHTETRIMSALDDMRNSVTEIVGALDHTCSDIAIAVAALCDKAEQHDDPELEQLAERLHAGAAKLTDASNELEAAVGVQAPATQPPVVAPPATEPPVVEAPAVEQPVEQPPVTDGGDASVDSADSGTEPAHTEGQ